MAAVLDEPTPVRTGQGFDVVALAAVRATREAKVERSRQTLATIVGVPIAGETAGADTFDGDAEAAVFPGDLPENPDTLFRDDGTGFVGLTTAEAAGADFRFLRFRPPRLEPAADGRASVPHIRMDRALQFLLGDLMP